MGRGTPSGGRGTARSNNSTYGNRGAGQNRNSKPDVSALGLVSPLGGGTGLSACALNALHSTVGIGGLGGLQQATQLSGSILELKLELEVSGWWTGLLGIAIAKAEQSIYLRHAATPTSVCEP